MRHQPVMVVEDNEFDLELTCHVFDEEKVLNDLVVSHDGDEAIDYLFGGADGGVRGVLPVMIVLDLNLPGMGGIEILRRIRADQRTRKVPVIVFTASQSDSDREKSIDGGATEYVQKSVNHRRFADSVRKMVTDWLDVESHSDGEGGNAD